MQRIAKATGSAGSILVGSFCQEFAGRDPFADQMQGQLKVYFQKVLTQKFKRQTHKRSGQKLEFPKHRRHRRSLLRDPNTGRAKTSKQGRAGIQESTQLNRTELSPC